MPKRKKASWVGPVNTLDTDTNLEKPLIQLSKTQRAEALKDSPSKKAAKPRVKKESEGPTGARPVLRPKTRVVLEEKGLREPTRSELKRGKTSMPIRNQERPAQAAGPNLPRIGQIYKHSDGRMMRVNPENIDEIHSDAKRTVLPEAGRDVMVQPGRPTPLPGPRGGLRINIPKNTKGNRSGLGVPHSVAKEHVDRAVGHLDAMAASEHGSGAYRQAQKSFQVVHGAMGEKNMSKPIHTMLQLAHNHIDSKLPGTEKMLNATKEAVGDTLKAGKKAEEERAFRQMQTDKGGN
jgi:hypothetical protein